MDKFVQKTQGQRLHADDRKKQLRIRRANGIVMDYYDGNTVTGLWNYAQHYAMNDNSYDNQFGPSTPGAINLISGDTEGAVASAPSEHRQRRAAGRPEPRYDQCANAATPLETCDRRRGTTYAAAGGTTGEMTGKNVGDLLNERGVTWGWFQGGFEPTSHNGDGRPICGQR